MSTTSHRVEGVARAAGSWAADRVWALGYFLQLAFASRH